MPKKKKPYFGKREEQAVIDFINSNCPEEQNRIFNEYLREPFRIMKEAILRKYPIHVGNYEMEEVEADALSHLIEQIHKFNPYMITKSGKPTKAYSYCQTIIRNYYRDHGKKTYSEKKTNLPYYDHSDDIQNNPEHSYEINNEEESSPINDLINVVVGEMEELIDSGTLKKNEELVGEAVVNIFKNWETLFLENTPHGRYNKSITNKFQKNKILLYIKEYTRLTTKEIRESLKVFKTLYFIKKEDFFDED